MWLIDHATRCSAAAVVKSKKKEDIKETIIKNWIAIFGAPRVILSDNGVNLIMSHFMKFLNS